jgi:PD-(D/E)XK nuclease superfamily
MALIFKAKDHSYTSIDPNDKTEWISVTTLISQFKVPFDAKAQAVKSAKNKRSKWFGMEPDDILKAWDNESNRSTTLGSWYHNQREEDLNALETITREGVPLQIIQPIILDDIKQAPDQRLMPGIYPEHFMYLKSAGICGQADRVEIVNEKVHIYDYKTNKEIKTQGFKNWEGIVERMLPPLQHMDNCHLIHYSLQMSLYMYMILKHNPNLSAGTLSLDHVIFEEDGKDDNGYPIHKLKNGEPVVKEVRTFKVPYMKSEVIAIIDWLNDNRTKLKPKH